MTPDDPADKMQKTGVTLSWLTVSAVAGMPIFMALFLSANWSSGAEDRAPLQHLIAGTTLALAAAAFVCEVAALVLLLAGAARWRGRILRSRRWMLSALGVGFGAVVILVFICICAVICVVAISPNP